MNKNDMKENNEGGIKNKFGLWQKVLRLASLILLSVCLGFGFYFFNARNVLHDPYPTIGNFGLSVVISGSMEPTINVNDAVITKAEEKYLAGDVIVYIEENGKSAVVHRIVNIDENGNYVTKGDANNSTDKPVAEEAVKGKVILTLPNAGMLFTEAGAYVLLAISLLLLLISLISEWRYRKAKQKFTANLQASIDEFKKANKNNAY